MCDLDKIRFETINNEIYINAKDVFKVYADNKNSAKTRQRYSVQINDAR